jgi:serine/threonine protein kinase
MIYVSITENSLLIGNDTGLDYLHAGCGILHRDVKSNNILLAQNFEAKVSDLGLARVFSGDQAANASLNTVCGTSDYIDPEYVYLRFYYLV